MKRPRNYEYIIVLEFLDKKSTKIKYKNSNSNQNHLKKIKSMSQLSPTSIDPMQSADSESASVNLVD